jgi:hypothetical protein
MLRGEIENGRKTLTQVHGSFFTSSILTQIVISVIDLDLIFFMHDVRCIKMAPAAATEYCKLCSMFI